MAPRERRRARSSPRAGFCGASPRQERGELPRPACNSMTSCVQARTGPASRPVDVAPWKTSPRESRLALPSCATPRSRASEPFGWSAGTCASTPRWPSSMGSSERAGRRGRLGPPVRSRPRRRRNPSRVPRRRAPARRAVRVPRRRARRLHHHRLHPPSSRRRRWGRCDARRRVGDGDCRRPAGRRDVLRRTDPEGDGTERTPLHPVPTEPAFTAHIRALLAESGLPRFRVSAPWWADTGRS